jgi:hypothetical protein
VLDRAPEIGKNLVARHGDDVGVQCGVGGNERLQVVRGERLLADALEFPEALDLLGRRLLGGQPCGFRFEKAARGE